jgi:hypothetical protein
MRIVGYLIEDAKTQQFYAGESHPGTNRHSAAIWAVQVAGWSSLTVRGILYESKESAKSVADYLSLKGFLCTVKPVFIE